MRNRVFGSLTVITVALLAGWLVLVSAADDPNQKPPGSELARKKADSTSPGSRKYSTRPDVYAAADVRIPLHGGDERVVYVIPQLQGSELPVPGLFFYTPAFCLAEADVYHDEWPKVVQYVDRQNDGSTRLGFRAILKSDLQKQHALDALREQPKARALWAGKDKLKETDLLVEHWPVVHAIIGLVNVRRESVYLAVTQAEVRGGSSVKFEFDLTASELAAVKRLAQEDHLGLVYSYSFIGKGQDHGVVDLQAVVNLKLNLGSMLTSEQLEGKAPIYQAQRDEAARYTAQIASKKVVGNNLEAMAMANTSTFAQHLFAPGAALTLDQLKQDSEQAKQVAAYLVPQVEKLRTEFRTDQANRKTDETVDFNVTTSEVSGQFGVGVLIAGVGINFGIGTSDKHSKGREVKSRVEAATGSEWVVGKESTTLIPHKIKVAHPTSAYFARWIE